MPNPYEVEDLPDVDLADVETQDEPTEGKTRRERRADRYDEMADRTRAAEERAAAYEQRLAQLEARLAHPPTPQGPTKSEVDQLDEEVQRIYSEQETLNRAYLRALNDKDASPEELSNYQKQAAILADRYADAAARRALKRNAPQPQNPADTELSRRRQVWDMKYTDIYEKPDALVEMQGELVKLIGKNGGKLPPETAVEQAADAVRAKFKIGRFANTPPSGQMVTAHGGYAPGAGNGSGKAEASVDLNDPMHKTLMNVRFGHLPHDKRAAAYQKMLKASSSGT